MVIIAAYKSLVDAGEIKLGDAADYTVLLETFGRYQAGHC